MPSEAQLAEPSCDDVKAAYEQGMNDAWELICKINKLSLEESEKVYGERFQYITDIIENITPQEAIEKLKAYEESKIKVGDVVEADGHYQKMVVTQVIENKAYWFDSTGQVGCYEKEFVKKTGKHIDIQSIFEQIGGE